MVVTYYIKLFCTRADRCNGNFMSLLPLVTETITEDTKILLNELKLLIQSADQIIRNVALCTGWHWTSTLF